MPTKIPLEEEQRRLQQLQYEIQFHETMESTKENTRYLPRPPVFTEEPKAPKKRGPKKKQMTPSRVARFKVRRIKANGRERDRMKSLNEELEVLRETIPCFSFSQKLSKIETLRLAKNYIEALTQMISHDQILDNTQFAHLLCKDLSPNTMNLVAATLSVTPPNQQIGMNDTYLFPSTHPRVQNALEFINLKKILTSESEDDAGIYSSTSLDQGSSFCGDATDSSMEEMSPSFPTEFYCPDPTSASMFTEPVFYPPNVYYPLHY